MKILATLILFIAFNLSYTPVLAQPGNLGSGNPSDSGNLGNANPSNPGNLGGGNPPTSDGNVTLMNPLGEGTTLIGFFQEILDVILVFAVPLIVFFIILAGFNYVMARGNPGKVETASQALLYAVVGGVIILGAYVILEVISGTINAFR